MYYVTLILDLKNLLHIIKTLVNIFFKITLNFVDLMFKLYFNISWYI